jgi:hypothetical protein
MKHLQEGTTRIEDMAVLGEDLQEKLSKSGSLNVSMKLNSIGSLKKSLTDDLNSQLTELDKSLKKWQRFHDVKDEFTSWLNNFKLISSAYFEKEIQLDTPNELKVKTHNIIYLDKEINLV